MKEKQLDLEVADEKRFNPLLHITAGQLRECGVKIPDYIPDCAWVPRDSINIQVKDKERKGDNLTINLQIEIKEAFHWLKMEVGHTVEEMIDCEKHGKVRGIEFANNDIACGQCFCDALREAGAEFNLEAKTDDQG